MILKFAKSRDVINPKYAHPTEDAGIDFYVPVFNAEFVRDLILKNDNKETYRVYINDESVYKKLQLSYGVSGIIKYSQNKITLEPHSRILIPSGIYVNVHKGRALVANNKSGICTKRGLIFGAAVVDHGYQGEVHLSIINTTNKRVDILENDKIIQFLYLVVDNEGIREVNIDSLYDNVSKRKDNGFGHTDETM